MRTIQLKNVLQHPKCYNYAFLLLENKQKKNGNMKIIQIGNGAIKNVTAQRFIKFF